MQRYVSFALTLGLVLSTLIGASPSWAISPDGYDDPGADVVPARKVGSRTPAAEKPMEILDDPSVGEVRRRLGIGIPRTKTLSGLQRAGFGSFIEFETDSATVIPSRGLEIIADALADLEPGIAIQITGHTDNVGSYDYNKSLSYDRAAAVRDWLEEHGVRAGVIQIRGASYSEPVCDDDSDYCRSRNRRVEFTRIYDND